MRPVGVRSFLHIKTLELPDAAPRLWLMRSLRRPDSARGPAVYVAVMAKRRSSDWDPRIRQTLVVVGVVEAGLKVAALIDLAQRPARQVHGSKAWWASAIVLVNSAGAVPIAYFLRGRK